MPVSEILFTIFLAAIIFGPGFCVITEEYWDWCKYKAGQM